MVEYSESIVERTKRRMQYVKEHEKELQPRTISVKIEKQDDFLAMASSPGSDFVWYADEAKEQGGQGKGASPLTYLLSSMGFCQLVHFAEHSMADKINIQSLEMTINGIVSMQAPRHFLSITYEVTIKSPEPDTKIKILARKAADDCYVTNTLKRSCEVKGIVFHNGKKIDE